MIQAEHPKRVAATSRRRDQKTDAAGVARVKGGLQAPETFILPDAPRSRRSAGREKAPLHAIAQNENHYYYYYMSRRNHGI